MTPRDSSRATLWWLMILASCLASGCASMFQASDKVLIREPGRRTYGAPVDVTESAKALWEHAVLGENSYLGEWKKKRRISLEQVARVFQPPEATPEAFDARCVPGQDAGPLPLSGWRMWPDFPTPALIKEAVEVGLFVEVWERESSPPVIAVVFRGTEFTSWKDWVSNLRWFIPWHQDQYTLVSKKVGQQFVDRLVDRRPDLGSNAPSAVRIVAVGHSLGGGLAQHLAYSLPPASSHGVKVPRVSWVYAFDPSPVTGWYSVDSDLREANAAELWIERIFEHGEILAYARLLVSYAHPPSAAHPSVREIRYNFVQSANPFSSHSMRLLACALIDASGQSRIPDLMERFGDR
ncbi:MAG: lipase family protein [Candidatus Rokuibacteriota bacterium]